MHNLSEFEQELCIMEQKYPHLISEVIFRITANIIDRFEF